MAKKKSNGHTALKPYKSYRFTTYDPEMERLRDIVLGQGVSKAALSRESGVSTGTFSAWWGGKKAKRRTKRPQNASIEAAGRAAGKMCVWVDLKKGG